jgi:hypothetical protein
VLADQGKPADAEAEFRQVLDARLRVLGPDHPDTLATAAGSICFSANNRRFR